jgi:hypothetical protein
VLRTLGRVALRVLGPVGVALLVYDVYTGLVELKARTISISANRRQSFHRTIDNLIKRIEDYNKLLDLLDKETDLSKIQELENTIKEENEEICSQYERVIEMAENLDKEYNDEVARRLRNGQNIPEHQRQAPYVNILRGAGISTNTTQQPPQDTTQPDASPVNNDPQNISDASPIPNTSDGSGGDADDGGGSGGDAIPIDDSGDGGEEGGSGSDVILKEETPEIPDATAITPEKLETRNKSITSEKNKENNNLDVDTINKNSMMSLTLKEFEKINFEARLIKFESTGALSKSVVLDATQNLSGLGNITGSMGNIAGDGRATNGSAAKALEFFQSKGWSLAQAAGIVANLDIETGGTFNPAAVGDGGKAYGIAQWHPDRQAHFQSWAGRSIRGSTFEQQLEFVNFELTQGREKRAGNRIRQTTTPQEAAAVTDQFYERSDGTARMRRIQRAITLASNASQNATQTTSTGSAETPAPAAQAATQTPSIGIGANADGAASGDNQNPAATPTEQSPATGANLAQAGTDMVAADQRQTLEAMNPVNVQQQSQIQPQQQAPKPNQPQMVSNDIPLRNRLESTFSYRS